jgi:hypothetical protein
MKWFNDAIFKGCGLSVGWLALRDKFREVA